MKWVLILAIVLSSVSCSTLGRMIDSLAGLDYRLRSMELNQKAMSNQIAFVMQVTSKNQGVDRKVAHIEDRQETVIIRLDAIDRDLYLLRRQLEGGGNPRVKKDLRRKTTNLHLFNKNLNGQDAFFKKDIQTALNLYFFGNLKEL